MSTRQASRSRGGRLITGMVSLTILAAMLVGVPVLLWLMRGFPLPTSLDLGQLKETLLQPDTDASLFVGAATIVGWLAWAWFAIGAVVEIVSQVRGVSMPSMPGLRISRRWAAGLIGGALLLAPVTATADPSVPAPAPVSSSAVQAPGETLNSIQFTVQSGNTLWDLAEVFLGDGHRWPEIQHANPGVDPDALFEGQVLTMPTNLLGAGHSYTVQTGDSLWDIATVFLGNGERWQELTSETGTPLQSQVIYPGQQIRIPVTTGTSTPAPAPIPAPDPPTAEDPQPATDAPADPAPPAPVSTPEQTAPPVASPAQTPAPVPGAEGLPPLPPGFEAVPTTDQPAPTSVPAPAPAEETPTRVEESPTPAPTDVAIPTTAEAAPPLDSSSESVSSAVDSEHDSAEQVNLVGVTGLVAAGLIAAVALRRRRQQHRRRRGEAIALPDDSAEATETLTRATASDDETLAKLDKALKSVAAHCTSTDQPLPALLGVSILDDSLALSMFDAEDLGLPAPWIRQEHGVWSLPLTARLSADTLADLNPYPALVQLGTTEGGTPMLINLEELGHLAVTSTTQEDSAAAARALALALALSPLANDIGLTLVGIGREIAQLLADDRVISWSADIDQVLDQLDRQTEHDAAALDAAEIESISEARSAGSGEANLEVVVFGDPLTADQQIRLHEIIARRPKVAVAAVCAGVEPGAEWTLSLTDAESATLTSADSGDGLALTPAMVSKREYADLIAILETSYQPAEQGPAGGPRPEEWAGSDVDEMIMAAEDPADLTLPPLAFSVVAGVGEHPARAEDVLAVPEFVVAEPESATDLVSLDEPAQAQPSPSSESPAPGVGEEEEAETNGKEDDQDEATSSDRLDEPIVVFVEQFMDFRDGAERRSPAGEVVELPHAWIRLMGTPTITPVSGLVAEDLPALKGRQGALTEAATILALRPGIKSADFDQLMWPLDVGTKTSAAITKKRQDTLTRLRKWLGETEDGEPAFPRHFDRSGASGYRLHESVLTDWQVWNQLLPQGPVAASTAHLEAAARLVRGRPLDGATSRRYTWAVKLQETMISEIVDALEELGARYLHAGDVVRAEEVATKTIEVEPSRESAWRLQLLALHARDTARTRQLMLDMLAYFDDLGVDDLEPETEELFNALSRYTTAEGDYPYRVGLPKVRRPRKQAAS